MNLWCLSVKLQYALMLVRKGEYMKKTFDRIGKIISSAVFVLLMIIIVLIVIYLIRVRVLTKYDRLGEVKLNFYTILTTSMVPTIDAGDIVITYKNDNNIYNNGDIITFVREGSSTPITHRVIDVSIVNDEYFYQTQGDHNATADTMLVSANNVIGRVTVKLPKLGYLQQFLVTKVGWITAIVLPCMAIVIYDILKVIRLACGKTKKIIKETDKTLEARNNLKKVIADGQ